MKNFTLLVAISTMAFAGCTCGQGWRPNILSRLHDRIHGVSDVGAPCDANCAPAMAPMAYAPPPGCTSCGDVSVGYGSYEGEYGGGYVSEPYSIGAPTTVPQTYATPPRPGETVTPLPMGNR